MPHFHIRTVGFTFWTKHRFSTQPVEQISKLRKEPMLSGFSYSKYLPQLEVKTWMRNVKSWQLLRIEPRVPGLSHFWAMTIRQPPALYTQCAGGTEYLSHTSSIHSMCAIWTALGSALRYSSTGNNPCWVVSLILNALTILPQLDITMLIPVSH